MKTLATLGLLLVTLSACSSPIYTPVEVDIPVVAPCKHDAITKPESVLKKLPPSSTIFDKTKAALIDIDYKEIYEGQLNAALTACGG